MPWVNEEKSVAGNSSAEKFYLAEYRSLYRIQFYPFRNIFEEVCRYPQFRGNIPLLKPRSSFLTSYEFHSLSYAIANLEDAWIRI